MLAGHADQTGMLPTWSHHEKRLWMSTALRSTPLIVICPRDRLEHIVMAYIVMAYVVVACPEIGWDI